MVVLTHNRGPWGLSALKEKNLSLHLKVPIYIWEITHLNLERLAILNISLERIVHSYSKFWLITQFKQHSKYLYIYMKYIYVCRLYNKNAVRWIVVEGG